VEEVIGQRCTLSFSIFNIYVNEVLTKVKIQTTFGFKAVEKLINTLY